MSVSTPKTIEVAHDHAHRGAQERVDPAAVAARPHVAPAPRGSRRVHSSTTSQTNSTSARVTLKPLAKNAR